MNIYRRIGDQVGTVEARDLAQQLVAWHDAMVKHLRVLSFRENAQCGEECPHDDALALWTAAQDTLGDKAQELAFLRSHAQPALAVMAPARGGVAEIRA